MFSGKSNLRVVCSVRKDQQQIAKAEFCDIVVSLFLDKWLLDNINLISVPRMLYHVVRMLFPRQNNVSSGRK